MFQLETHSDNEALASRLLNAILGWYSKAEPPPMWTDQALAVLRKHHRDTLVAMHGVAMEALETQRTLPTVPQLAGIAKKAAGVAFERKSRNAQSLSGAAGDTPDQAIVKAESAAFDLLDVADREYPWGDRARGWISACLRKGIRSGVVTATDSATPARVAEAWRVHGRPFYEFWDEHSQRPMPIDPVKNPVAA